MTVLGRVRKYWRAGKRLLVEDQPVVDPADQAAWADALMLWDELFGQFPLMVEGARVLELGCGDGRMLGALVNSGAGSGTGFDRHAYWSGEGRGAPWRADRAANLSLSKDIAGLDRLDEGSVDLVLARELDGFLALDGLEDRLAQVYELLRPGGDMVARLRCGGPGGGLDGPGYGFMTPTAWVSLLMSVGFEIVELRRVWRDPVAQGRAASWLPDASDDERLSTEIHVHLIRPWESWELDNLKAFGDQRREKRKR